MTIQLSDLIVAAKTQQILEQDVIELEEKLKKKKERLAFQSFAVHV